MSVETAILTALRKAVVNRARPNRRHSSCSALEDASVVPARFLAVLVDHLTSHEEIRLEAYVQRRLQKHGSQRLAAASDGEEVLIIAATRRSAASGARSQRRATSGVLK